MIEIIYEDEAVLALCKPSGTPSIPGRGEIGEALSAAAARHTGGKLFTVHRLDRDASGLIIFAKDAAAHRLLCARFEAREAEKTYLALVLGELRGEGLIDAPLKEFGSGRVAAHAQGKPSRTRWKALRGLSNSTLLEVSPLTGRRHQLRAHLYGLGHPILGDRRYGRPVPVGGAPRLMLHALSLSLLGPKGPLSLRAEPTADFLAVLEQEVGG
jgi:RluA family pseudouridine synthase